MDSLTVEQTILLAATDPALQDRTRSALAAALASSPDWTQLVTLALAHSLTPGLLSALESADAQLVPPDLLAGLRQHCQELRERCVYLRTELFALLDDLKRASIAAVPFKGPLMAERLFGDIGQRVPGDLDLLVGVEDIPIVRGLLEQRGYADAEYGADTRALTPRQHRMYLRFQCEYLFERASDQVIVEPHWELSPRAMAIDADYRGMLVRAVAVSSGTHDVRALAADDLLLALCIHGGKHRWERLSWVRDVAATVARLPQLDLVSAVAQARRRGCARMVLLGLALARQCAGLQLPPNVVRLVDSDTEIPGLVDTVMTHVLHASQLPGNINLRVDRFRFRLRERRSDRARYVFRTLLLPRREHIELVTLPPGFLWAYYPLAWSYRFLARPVWRALKPVLHTSSAPEP